jgi:hypothetical protein
MARWRAQEGQAAVEFVALAPLLVLLVLALWQGVVAGHAAWMAGAAAREAARARALGHDPAAAARRVLPRRLEHGLVVRDDGDGVRVRVEVPVVVSHLRLGRVSARARMEPQA